MEFGVVFLVMIVFIAFVVCISDLGEEWDDDDWGSW